MMNHIEEAVEERSATAAQERCRRRAVRCRHFEEGRMCRKEDDRCCTAAARPSVGSSAPTEGRLDGREAAATRQEPSCECDCAMSRPLRARRRPSSCPARVNVVQEATHFASLASRTRLFLEALVEREVVPDAVLPAFTGVLEVAACVSELWAPLRTGNELRERRRCR